MDALVELDVLSWESPELAQALIDGLAFFSVPIPISLDDWANQHFYLSKESSYVEGNWESWPYQRAPLCCIGNDEINSVILKKSARIGYTKMLLAAIGYYAEHKRRNIALWQPTDGDRNEFVKTEIDPFLRDVRVLHRVFTALFSRGKDNTLELKKFLGGLLHLKGGTAAGNYRRISIDVAFMDELDAFLRDVDKEGSPVKLAQKRIEGATFPKFVAGSTPKTKGFSAIDDEYASADVRMLFCIPCPECCEYHPLIWSFTDSKMPRKGGMSWVDGDPETVRHACPHCGTLIDQGQYLQLSETHGRYRSEDGGLWLDFEGKFTTASGVPVAAPKSVAFQIWTAYNPRVSWSIIVREYLAAKAKEAAGDNTLMKTFINTTLGLSFEEKVEKTNIDVLRDRAKVARYTKGILPMGCLLLLAGCDTQNDRIEVVVWGYGRGMQTWCVEYVIFYGNPSENAIWEDLAGYLFKKEFSHVSGRKARIYASAIDSGGHHTHDVYSFVDDYPDQRIFAIKGYSGSEKNINQGASLVEINAGGKKKKAGMKLWSVGTNLAKDLLYGRLQIERAGPGYVNFYNGLSDEFFAQLGGEDRYERAVQGGFESRWSKNRARVEVLDCTVYAIWLEIKLNLGNKYGSYWDELEAELQPPNYDLFADPAPSHAELPALPKPVPVTQAPEQKSITQPINNNPFAPDEWLQRGWE